MTVDEILTKKFEKQYKKFEKRLNKVIQKEGELCYPVCIDMVGCWHKASYYKRKWLGYHICEDYDSESYNALITLLKHYNYKNNTNMNLSFESATDSLDQVVWYRGSDGKKYAYSIIDRITITKKLSSDNGDKWDNLLNN